MANIIQGNLTTNNEKFCIIISRFNEFIGSKLLSGAIDELVRHGIKEETIDIIWTPGAFEIPVIAKKAAKTGKYDAIITLGAVIKGATGHYDFVAAEVSKGIASVSLTSDIPVMFGVLTGQQLQAYALASITTDHESTTYEQAIERAGTKAGNKGSEAAKAAIEMANLAKLI